MGNKPKPIQRTDPSTPPAERTRYSRRLKRVAVSGSFILEIAKTSGPRVVSVEGVPPDAKPLRIYYDQELDLIWAIFEHESFPQCFEGNIPEIVQPVISTHYGDCCPGIHGACPPVKGEGG